jgi:hypothetical protein
MKIPKRITDIISRKQGYIDSQRDKLEAKVIKQQSKLLSEIISQVVPELDLENGMIKETVKNYRTLSVLAVAYKNFQKGSSQTIFNQVVNATSKIAELNKNYFKTVLLSDVPKTFEKVIEATDKLMNLRIGLDGGKLVRGGFLESFFNENVLGTNLKQFTSKAITSNMDKADYIKGLRQMITGSEDTKGGLERQFQRYAYDLYQQYDAAYNLTIGNELGFKYFIYQGGLVEDSRDFCREHNNHVYSIDEAEGWGEWTPSQSVFITDFKQKDINSVPSYLGYAGYDPLIDRGGYNCRHSLGWIPDELAFELRPDLI